MRFRAIAAAALLTAAGAVYQARADDMGASPGGGYLPDGDAAKVVSVSRVDAMEQGGITVLTEAVTTKAGGPQETVAKFGEVYAFSPAYFVLKKGEATLIHFWNLQAGDEHDVAVLDDKGNVFMDVKLPPLSDTALRFTFHKKGLYTFRCLMHQPEMSGQILVQ